MAHRVQHLSPPVAYRGRPTGLIVRGESVGTPGLSTTVKVGGVAGTADAFSSTLLTGTLSSTQTAVTGLNDVIVEPPGGDTGICPPPPIIIVDPPTPEEAIKAFSPQIGADVKSYLDEAQDKVDVFVQEAMDAPTKADVNASATNAKNQITSAKTLVDTKIDEQKTTGLAVLNSLGASNPHVEALQAIAEKGKETIRDIAVTARRVIDEVAVKIKVLKP